MKTGLITPVTNIDLTVKECKEHLMSEFCEVTEAYTEYVHDESGTCKATAHLVEELVDLATACMTLADRIEKESDIPQLVNNTLLMVGAKNYARGYHSENPIALMEFEDLTRNRVRDLETIGTKNKHEPF